MRYYINACLIYDAADGSLTPLDSAFPSSQLSITASALLLFFMQNHDVVHRDKVLKCVWDDQGHTSSNSNLNQYLSMLRKTFRTYGIDNIILSISRGNLQFNPAISIESLDPLEQSLPAFKPDAGDSAHHLLPQKKYLIAWYIASLILLCISVLLVALTFNSSPAIRAIGLTRLSQGECELSAPEDMLAAFNPESYKLNFNRVRERLNMACRPGRIFIFNYEDKLEKQGLGRVFLAHCVKLKNNDFSYCENYFYYAWNP